MIRNDSFSLLGFAKRPSTLVIAAVTVFLLGVSSTAQAVHVATYNMNEASWNSTPGEVLDSTGHGFNATDVNYPAASTAGTFNGVNQYVITPNLTSQAHFSTSVGISLNFNATVGGGGGVLVDELGQTGINTGWHDSQIEMEANGHILERVWPTASIDLGAATFGVNHHVTLNYDATTGTLSGSLDGVTTSMVVGARQAPWANGFQQFYGIGAADSGTNMGNGQFFNGSISNVQITTTPEPSSLILCGLGAVGLIVAARRRRKA